MEEELLQATLNQILANIYALDVKLEVFKKRFSHHINSEDAHKEIIRR